MTLARQSPFLILVPVTDCIFGNRSSNMEWREYSELVTTYVVSSNKSNQIINAVVKNTVIIISSIKTANIMPCIIIKARDDAACTNASVEISDNQPFH